MYLKYFLISFLAQSKPRVHLEFNKSSLFIGERLLIIVEDWIVEYLNYCF